jgi:cell wall assembly regulator SMI1
MEDNYQELFDNLCEGATTNDVNELEHELDCTLPVDVRESLQVHDGQERGGRPTGILFGCMLLDCEEIVEEWNNWRVVNEQYLAARPRGSLARAPTMPVKALGSDAGPSKTPDLENVPIVDRPKTNSLWKEQLLDRQESQPPNAVQKAYAHPSWIPLARDWGGNCIAVDLAPGPMGKWGQIIIFGRDYDCKFVIARSWADFLARVADDFGSGDRVLVDEEEGHLKFLQFKEQGVEPPYLEILRWRCDQKYGRRAPKRRGPNGGGALKINPNVGGPAFEPTNTSPYSSPTTSERGRSPHRLGGKAPVTASPLRPHVSSPLARVTEEGPAPLRVHTDFKAQPAPRTEKLVSVDTPRPSGDFPVTGFSMSPITNATNKSNFDLNAKRDSGEGKENKSTLSSNSKALVNGETVGEMKTVEI